MNIPFLFLLLLLLPAIVPAQTVEVTADQLFFDVMAWMKRPDVEEAFGKGGWHRVKSDASSFTVSDTSEKDVQGTVTASFDADDRIETLSVVIRLTKGAARENREGIDAMERALIDRAERTERKNGRKILVHTASDGTTVRTRWERVSVTEIRVVVTCGR